MNFSNADRFWVVNWSTDCDGRCASIDPQWQGITGQKPERALGEGWLEAVHQDDQEQAKTQLARARRSERSFQVIVRLRQADGQFRWALAVGAPRYDAQGACIGHSGAIIDFHDRIAAQRELSETRQRLEAVMNAAPVGLSYSTDPSCAFITGNKELFTQFEIDASDNASASAPDPGAAGRRIRYLKDGRELTESELPLQVASREGRAVQSMEMEVELPSGRRWRLEASSAPIVSPDGGVLGAVAVTVDVTEGKERLDELRLSEQRFRTLFESSRDGIVTVDMSGRIIEANPAYQEMLGYTLEELKRLTYQELTPEVWREMEAAIVREHILPRGESAEYEKEYVRKDGRVFPISLRTWVVTDDQGRIVGMRAFVRDITERKAAEAALRDNEQRMRRFYDSGLLGVIYWNVAGAVTDANDRFLEMVGYTRADLQEGRINWLELTPPELLHLDEAAIREVKATGFNASPFEKQFFHRNGSRVPVIVAGAMLDEARFNGVAFVLDITERKQAEAALRASERRFRAIFNQQYQYSALLSADGLVIEVSESVIHGTGVPREEIVGRPLLDAPWWRNVPDARARLQAQFDEARARPGPSHGEGAYETRDGAQRYALNTVTALRDEWGEIEFLLVEGIDITARKQAELALRDSQQQLALALEAGQLGFWDWDVPSGRVQFGGRWASMLGYERSEIEPHLRAWETLIHPDEREAVAARVSAHLEGRTEFYECEHRLRHKDGSWRWILDRGQVVERDAQGKPQRAIGTHADVTSRHEAEAGVRDSEERFRASFANASIGFAMNGPDYQFLDANPAYCALTGYSLEELRAHKGSELIHPDDWPANEALVKRMAVGEIPGFVIENRYVRKTGEDIWVRKSVSLIRHADGSPRWLITLVEDVTERKEAEEALQQSRNDLDRAQEVGKIGWWRLDVRQNVLTWSDENYRIFGVPKGTPLSYNIFLSMVHPDDRDYVDAQWQAALRGEPYDIEHRIVSGDDVKWVREKAYLEFDAAGALLGGFGITQDLTELRQAEQALRESEALLRLATEAAKIGAFDWRLATGVNTWTPELEAMYGLAPGEFSRTQCAWEQLVHPDDRAGAVAKCEETLATGEPVEHEWRVIWPDGSVHWIAGRFQGIKDAGGKPLRLTGVNIDITGRKLAETALRMSEKRFRALVLASSDAVYRMSPDWDEMRHLVGHDFIDDTAEPSQTWLQKYILPEDQPNVLAAIRAAIRTTSVFDLEHRVLRADRGVGWTHSRAIPIFDESGAITEWFGMARDVTMRKEAEESLRKSRALLQAVLDSSPDAIFLKDREGRLLLANPATFAVTGKSPEECIGKTDDQIYDNPDDGRAIMANDRRVMESGQTEIVEETLSAPSGTRYFVSNKAPYRDAEGNVIGLVGTARDITEYKEAEAALRESELRYRTLVEAASAVAWRCPPSGLHVEPQPEWMAFTGQTAEEMLGDGWSKAIHPDDLAEAASKWREAVARGALFENEHRIRRHDGQWRWMSVQVAPVHDARGEIVEWFGMNIDITERKEAEEQLRASEETLLNAQRSARAGVWDIDLIANRVAWSEPYYELFGLPRSMQPSYENWIASIHPDDRPRVEAEYARLLETRDAQQIEFRIIRDGRVRWLHREGRVIYDDAGRPLRVAGITWDITERKRAEEALLWHMRRSELLSETAAQLLASEDPQRLADELCNKVMTFLDCDLFFNYLVDEEACRLRLNACAGVPAELTPSFEWLDLDAAVCGCVASRRERIIAEDIQNDSDPRTELVKSLGIQAYCCHPLLHQDRVIGTLSFGARSRAYFSADEIAVMKAVTDLVAIAMRRGETEQALREADRRKDEFLATLAHELRNPLAPIQNALHILRKKHGPEYPDARLLDMMQRQVGHLIRLVEDLLEVSRISRGKIELRKEFVILQTILSDALETCQPLIDKKAHQVIANMPDEPIWLFGDPVRLTQIVANIVNNAAKYTPPGGRIEVEAEREGDKLVLHVRDNGVGISGDMMPRVFDLFAQTDGQIRLSEGGLGIGLALVRSLVELHGGRVHARSAGVGRGSEFTLTLPLADPDGAKC